METPPRVENLGFVGHAMRRKHSFIHWLLMGGVLLFSMKTAGQKYRIDDLHEEKTALQEERKSLHHKFTKLKEGLLEEAAKANNSAFTSRLHALLSEPPGSMQKKIHVFKDKGKEKVVLHESPDSTTSSKNLESDTIGKDKQEKEEHKFQQEIEDSY